MHGFVLGFQTYFGRPITAGQLPSADSPSALSSPSFLLSPPAPTPSCPVSIAVAVVKLAMTVPDLHSFPSFLNHFSHRFVFLYLFLFLQKSNISDKPHHSTFDVRNCKSEEATEHDKKQTSPRATGGDSAKKK